MSIKVFYCYAHEDKVLRALLEKHLGNIKQQELITGWSDRNIDAGKEWVKEIDNNLNTANIILLLISPDFMHSEYCYSIEMKRALERHENGTARVIPIILRHVEHEDAPFSRLQALPTGALPVTDRKWRTRDEAFFDVAQGIRKVVKELLSEQLLYDGNIYFYREQYENALTAFERAIYYNPSNASAYIGQGESLYQLATKEFDFLTDESYNKALAAFEQAISLDGTNANAYVGKAKVLLKTNDFFYDEPEKLKILEALEQSITLDPRNAAAYTVQGDAFMEFQKYEEACTAYEKAIQFAAYFNRYAYNKKGDALLQLEAYADSINTYDLVIQEMPNHVYAHVQKGNALLSIENYQDSLAAYQQAITLNYPDASIYTQMGKVLDHLNRYSEAIVAYERAIQLGSESVKAEAYRGKGNILKSQAQVAFKKADELDPDPFLPDYPDDLS